jgi:hypothetical protein
LVPRIKQLLLKAPWLLQARLPDFCREVTPDAV